jgi:vacuolar protein sorting-associated protein 54
VFLQTFHQARISQSAKLVEDELWNPAEVTLALQRIADVLVDAAVRDSPDLILSSGSPSSPTSTPTPASAAPPPRNGTLSPPPSSSGNRTKTNGSSATKHIRIEDRTYFIVSATADVLGLLMDYLKVIVNLSMLTTDTMSRVIEFLKAFNSRTCQVVLGAGAMRSAGLKNITAKHLGAWLQLINKLWCFFFGVVADQVYGMSDRLC